MQDYANQAVNQGGIGKAEPPRTISSAAGRIDELNVRLVKLSEAVSMISNQIGAMTLTAGSNPARDTLPESGAVNRLNSAANQAHMTLSEIENLVNGISRALG